MKSKSEKDKERVKVREIAQSDGNKSRFDREITKREDLLSYSPTAKGAGQTEKAKTTRRRKQRKIPKGLEAKGDAKCWS